MVDCKYTIDRSNLYQVRRQTGDALCDLDSRVNTIELIPVGGLTLSYRYSIALTGDPTAGHAGADTLDPTTVTELRISTTTDVGNDATGIIVQLRAGDVIGYSELVAPNGTSYYFVDSLAVDQTDYFSIAVTPTTIQNMALPVLDDTPMDIHFIPKRVVVHDDLDGINPDNHHNQLHNLYSSDHPDVDTVSVESQRDLLAFQSADQKYHLETRMNWLGLWVAGTYFIHDVVVDSPYTMVANKTTTDRPAPIDIGLSRWDMLDTPAWSDFAETAVVGSGHSYAFSETVEVNAVRVWIPVVGIAITYKLTTVASGFIDQRILEELTANEWNTIAINPVLVLAGSTVLYYLESLNSGATSQVTGRWTKRANDNNAEPVNASWNQNVQRTTLRVDFDDLDTINRQVELESIAVGSTIQFVETLVAQNGITYQVLSPPVTGSTSVSWDVKVIAEGVTEPAVGAETTMTASIPIPQSTQYVGIVNGWVGNEPIYADVTSFLSFDGVDQGVDPDNQYGVSINVQRMQISPDWDLLSIIGGSGGGDGGGGDPFPEAPTDGQTYGRIGLTTSWEPVYNKTESDDIASGASVKVFILDEIQAGFNGSATVFDLRLNAAPISDTTKSEEFMVSLNGLMQDPDSYSIATSQITFSEAPRSNTEAYIIWFQPIDALVQKMLITGYIEVPQVKNYPSVPWGTFDHTITGIYIAVETGSMNVSVLINNAPAAGLTNINVTTAPTLIEGLSLPVTNNRQVDMSVNSLTDDPANLEFSIFTERLLT